MTEEVGGMGTATLARPTWVVRNRQGRVVVIFAGTDAEVEATHWRSRGYVVSPLEEWL